MKVDWNSKYTTVSVYTVITFAICLALVIVVSKFSVIMGALGTVLGTISAVIWGIAIAYLLNPVMMRTERQFKKLLERKKPHPKLCRFISTVLAIIFGIAVICTLVAIIVPQVLDSLMNIFNNAQNYMNNIYNWVNTTLAEYPEIVTYLNNQLNDIQSAVLTAVNNLIPKVGDWAVKLKDGAVGLLAGLKDFIIGFIVAVYLLLDKEKFLAQGKKLMTAIFPQKICHNMLRAFRKTNNSLNGFINGKILDSFIIGMICFVAMKLMKLEYSVLISVIVGVTNVIPFFGPFIGAIPSALVLFLVKPSSALWFIVFIIVLQQLENNLIYPKVVGKSVGMPSVLILIAIIAGAELGGAAGIMLGIPLLSAVYMLVKESIEEKA